MNQNVFCKNCHRTPNQCGCISAPRELSDEEIISCMGMEMKTLKEEALEFAKAILKKASEK
jgi:hypothetical protein